MDKTEIIERLGEIAKHAVHIIGEEPFIMSLDDGIAVHEAINMLRSHPEPHWIPCSERLPEAEVLCCDTRGEMIIGYPYQDDESETGYSAVFDDVYMVDCIAWMEKPEPYREGEG